MNINEDILTDEGKAICDLTNIFTNKNREIEKLNHTIIELEKCIKEKYHEAIDYQAKIRQSDLMQGDYPVSYYYSEQQELICNYFLNKIKDLKKGE